MLPYDPDETREKPRKRLEDACKAYGIEGWEGIDKETISKDIGEGRWRVYGREVVLQYNEEDVRVETELLRRQLTGQAIASRSTSIAYSHWSKYSAKTVSRIQARGMPIDMCSGTPSKRTRPRSSTALLRRFDPSYGEPDSIYTPMVSGATARFERGSFAKVFPDGRG